MSIYRTEEDKIAHPWTMTVYKNDGSENYVLLNKYNNDDWKKDIDTLREIDSEIDSTGIYNYKFLVEYRNKTKTCITALRAIQLVEDIRDFNYQTVFHHHYFE
jgi:hypothetical protein